MSKLIKNTKQTKLDKKLSDIEKKATEGFIPDINSGTISIKEDKKAK